MSVRMTTPGTSWSLIDDGYCDSSGLQWDHVVYVDGACCLALVLDWDRDGLWEGQDPEEGNGAAAGVRAQDAAFHGALRHESDCRAYGIVVYTNTVGSDSRTNGIKLKSVGLNFDVTAQ